MVVSRIGAVENVVVVVGAAGGHISSSSDMLLKSFFFEKNSETTGKSFFSFDHISESCCGTTVPGQAR